MSTLAGYLWSLRLGLFGFREVRTTAGLVTGTIETSDSSRSPVRVATELKPSSSIAVAVSLPDRESRVPLLAGRWVTGVLAFLAALSLATSLSNADAASARTGART